MATLYRKYRPQRFAEISGQNHIKITLQNEISNGDITHAYLFCGPRGTGKTTMARLLAKALNCQERPAGEYEPCNKCSSCQDITASRSLDVVEMDAASNTGVDNVRENIINGSMFMPGKSKYKIFIIDEVHMLSASAFNALLKILEEPPQHVIFILATTELHKIIPTIVSRCQRFDFKKIGYKDLSQKLKKIVAAEGINVSDQVLDLVASHSDGCLRDAESLLGQVLSVGDKNITLEQAQIVLPVVNYQLVYELMDYLAHKDTVNAIKLINNLVEDGVNLDQFNKDLIEYLRKMLLYKINGQLDDFSLELDESAAKNIMELSAYLPLPVLIKMIDLFVKIILELKTAVICQLPLELAVIEAIGLMQSGATALGQAGFSAASLANSAVKAAVEQQKEPPTNPNNKDIQEKIQEIGFDQAKKEEMPASDFTQNESEAILTGNNEQNKENQNSVSLPNEVSDEITIKWQEAVSRVRKENYSLSCVLGASVLAGFDGTKITVAFKHKFNLDKTMEPKNRSIVLQQLKEVFGRELLLECIINNNLLLMPENNNSVTLEEARKYNQVTNGLLEKEPEKENPAFGNAQEEKNNNGVQTLLEVFDGKVVQ